MSDKANIALVFGVFSAMGVVILFCEKLHRYISYIREVMMWEHIFGSKRLIWLMQHIETGNAMRLCHHVLKTTCLARCKDTPLKNLLDSLDRIPILSNTPDTKTDGFDLVFICQLIFGKNILWRPKELNLSSSSLAWDVVLKLLILQRSFPPPPPMSQKNIAGRFLRFDFS